MRLRNIAHASEFVEECAYTIKNGKEQKGYYKKLFSNNNPIHIEIGMGKGNFIINMAKKYPDINFIGIEKYPTVMLKAVKKLENENLPNLKLLIMDANEINDYFANEIDTIYLNFSDPWPKKRHEKRRLTSNNFLVRYKDIFADVNKIIMKTDNRKLFEYSLMEFVNYDYKIDFLSLDLYNDEVEDNVPTEYEMKFHSKGFPIYKVEVSKKV